MGFSCLPAVLCGIWASKLGEGAALPGCQQVNFARRGMYLFCKTVLRNTEKT